MLILALMVVIVLVPAVLLRWVILRRPLTTWPAAGVTLLLFFGLVALANAFSWEPSPGMVGAAVPAFFILKQGHSSDSYKP